MSEKYETDSSDRTPRAEWYVDRQTAQIIKLIVNTSRILQHQMRSALTKRAQYCSEEVIASNGITKIGRRMQKQPPYEKKRLPNSGIYRNGNDDSRPGTRW